MNTDQPLRILSFTAEHVKRLKFVEIDPNKNFVVIAGNNGQGKSSILDAMTLGGKNSFGPNPINKNATEAVISLDFGRFKVTRIIKGGSTSLKIEGADGERFPSPQTLLDGLIGEMFDPWMFAEMKKDKQMQTLKDVVGIDFSELDEEYNTLFTHRTVVGQNLRQENARLADLPEYRDVKEKVDVTDIMQSMKNAQEANEKVEKSKLGLTALKSDLEVINENRCSLDSSIDTLESELKVLKDEIITKVASRNSASASALAKEKEISTHEVSISKMEVIDLAVFTAKTKEAEDTNEKFAANSKRDDQRKRVSDIKSEHTNQTKRLEEIKSAKSEKMSTVKFPIKELTFDDDKGVLFNGMEFDSASSSDRLKASVAVGVALYPKMPIMLVRRGSDLDTESLRTLHHLAVEQGAQIWIERVGEDGPASLIIEDGSVKEVKNLSI